MHLEILFLRNVTCSFQRIVYEGGIKSVGDTFSLSNTKKALLLLIRTYCFFLWRCRVFRVLDSFENELEKILIFIQNLIRTVDHDVDSDIYSADCPCDRKTRVVVAQRVSHRPIKCQSRLWPKRHAKVIGLHHGDSPLLKPTGIQIAIKSLPGPINHPRTSETYRRQDDTSLGTVRTTISTVRNTASTYFIT